MTISDSPIVPDGAAAPDRAQADAATILTPVQAEACLDFARAGLVGAEARPAAEIPDVPFDKVNLTLYLDARLRASVSGYGASLAQAIAQAARRALTDDRFGPPIGPADIPRARLELWIQHGAEPIADPAALDLGLDGVELELGGRTAYFKPSVALTKAIPAHDPLLERLARKAGLAPGAWRAPGAALRRTRWEHYAERPGERPAAIRLRRLRPAESPPMTRAEALEAAMLATQRLLVTQQAEGFYAYEDHPFRPAAAVGPVNFVRQAGCAFAVARAAEAFADRTDVSACVASADRAVGFLLKLSVARGADAACLVEPGASEGKLGLNALTLAALQRRSLAGRNGEARAHLTAGVLSMQRDDGSFRCSERSRSAAADGRLQDYYPGEALMALCREINGASDRPLRAVERAFAWHRDYFRRNPTTAFVPWQAEAWRLLADWRDENPGRGGGDPEEYAAFVFELVDWLLRLQLDETTQPADFAGGFAAAGQQPGASTSTYAEAVARAFGLARRRGDAARSDRYRRAARSAIGFVLRLRLPRPTAFLFGDPMRIVGGTTRSFRDMTIRCDYDQHTITALLAALETPGLLEE